MDTTVIIAAFSLLTGVIASLVAPRLRSFFASREKKLISTNEAGKQEIIIAPADASPSEIEHKILRSIRFEKSVADALQHIETINTDLKFRPSKKVDFIGTFGGTKFAIEAKLDLKHFNLPQIRRYLSAENDIKNLLIVSPERVNDRVLKILSTDPYLKSVRFLRVENEPGQMERQISEGIESVINPARV